MATITCLPNEVIIIILSYSDITIEDIINFRCVCKRFRLVAKFDKFLETKFLQRWASTKKFYDKQFKENEQEDEENEQNNEKDLNFIETGINCARQLRNYVSRMIQTYYNDTKSIDNLIRYDMFECNEYDYYRDLIRELLRKDENFIRHSFFIDELKNLITQSPGRTGCDLTEEYLNQKFFHYMKQRFVERKRNIFLRQPLREQLLERVATFMAQWIQPEKNVFYSHVKAPLDNIAQEVLNFLREKHPFHSIFLTSAESFSYWENNNIDDNHWNEAEGTQIMDTLNEYIFDKLNFRPCRLKDRNLKYMCIDHVLEKKYGHQFILLIIYHCVARRLGLRCDITKARYTKDGFGIFCIYWKPKYAEDCSRSVRCFNISCAEFPDCIVNQLWPSNTKLYTDNKYIERDNVRKGLMRVRRNEFFFKSLIISNVSVPSLDHLQRIEGIEMFDIIRGDFKSKFVAPDIRAWLSLAPFWWYDEIHENSKNEYFIYNQRNIRYPIEIMPNIFQNCRLNVIKLRVKKSLNRRDIKFAVGMIVTHSNKSAVSCTGVIIGWHRYRDMDQKFKLFKNIGEIKTYAYIHALTLKHCRNISFKKHKVNYIILIDNNKICYVEEDAIALTTPRRIDNSETGRYFCKFEGTHYVPNKMLKKRYPLDNAITRRQYLKIN